MAIRINFADFCKVIQASIHTGELDFALSLTEEWKRFYPGDIQADIFIAELSFLQNKEKIAEEILKDVLNRDPENLSAYALLIKYLSKDAKYFASAYFAFTGKVSSMDEIDPWATTLRAVKKEFRKHQFQHAQRLIKSAISESPNNILVAIEHYRVISKTADQATATNLLSIYRKRWPRCLQFRIWQALDLLECGGESDAIELLHESATLDPAGSVSNRILGPENEINSFYNKQREIRYDGEIPTSVAISLEWNQLPSGFKKQTKGLSSDRHSRSTDSKISVTSQEQVDQRSSEKVYVILTSITGLQKKYGPKSADVVIDNLKMLSAALDENPRWKPIVFIPDEAASMRNIGLQEIKSVDPWKIKLSLMDLNSLLGKSNQSIGAVLIVGNNEVIPFHHLPNPTEDSDEEVLSDNPYATSTSNYLLPEWMVGRLPGEKGSDPGLLLELIRHITQFHREARNSKGFVATVQQYIRRAQNIGRFLRELFRPPNDFGYSAQVWRRSSIAAFRPIGKGADLRVSPPYDNDTIDIEKLLQAKSAYFNLHGLATTNEWYGQKDFSEPSVGPDFPVAIKADNISNITNNIDLVLTEACYGGYIVDKAIEESIALKLLSIGSQGVVGSSCISYGSVFTPLIGGDLLAFIFWKYIKDGHSFGDALLQAKIGLIKVMMQRQGYLDGEDQKTVLSFNLYGDPLGCLEEIVFLDDQNHEKITESDLNLVSDANGVIERPSVQKSNLSKDISGILESYIPGLESANIRVRKHKIVLKNMMRKDAETKGGSNLSPTVITQMVYEKSFEANKHIHTHFARVTMDDSGKVMKLAVSR